jgi:hypothetical protein
MESPIDLVTAAVSLGPLNRCILHNTSRSTTDNMKAVLQHLATLRIDRYGDSLMHSIIKAPHHRSWLIHNGDVREAHKPDSV